MRFTEAKEPPETVLRTWIEMARRKHAWPAEADGVPQAYGVLASEVRELRNAVDKRHPQEHVISELLDVITVATRMLNGEHLTGWDRVLWLESLQKVKPTEPGEIGPYDEHKERA